MRKKASLTLSINAIVILILAITMLGLGLAFMRNIFGKATGEFNEISGEIQRQVVEQMKESDKIIDLSGSVYDIEPGEKKMAYIGFRNDGEDTKKFIIKGVKVNSLSGNDANCGLYDEEVILEYKQKATEVKPGATTVLPINIKASTNALKDTCFYEILIDEEDDSLVGYWNFNDVGEDDVVDEISGEGIDGTAVNGAVFEDESPDPAFDGAGHYYDSVVDADDHVHVIGNGIYDLRRQITASAWIRRGGSCSGKAIVLHPYSTSSYAWMLYCSGRFRFYVNPLVGSAKSVAMTSTPVNTWYHVVGTYDMDLSTDESLKLYVDGELVDTNLDTGGILVNGVNDLYMGVHYQTKTNGFNGQIDDVKIYNRALSASEVKQLSQGYDESIQLTVNVE